MERSFAHVVSLHALNKVVLRKQAAAASGEGGPQELDLATTLASFPPEVRDEVLMTADEEMLAQLPPAILAEAQASVSHRDL